MQQTIMFEYIVVQNENTGALCLEKVREIIHRKPFLEMEDFIAFCKDYCYPDGATEDAFVIAIKSDFTPFAMYKSGHKEKDGAVFKGLEVFQFMVLSGAEAFFVVHHHGDGAVLPTEQDIKKTAALKYVGSLMCIRLCDHVILNNHDFYSFADTAILGDLENTGHEG